MICFTFAEAIAVVTSLWRRSRRARGRTGSSRSWAEEMMLQQIPLRLARAPEHPGGSLSHGYDIVAPLDATGSRR